MALADKVKGMIGPNDNVLIIEDSSHTYENTLNVLQSNSSLVKPGGYFIVEDSICHHGLEVGPKPGPYEAIQEFLAETHQRLRAAGRPFPSPSGRGSR